MYHKFILQNWDAILWVDRPTELWAVQLLLAMISLTEALLIAYLSYKVSAFKFLQKKSQNSMTFIFFRVTFGNKFYPFTSSLSL